MPAGPALSFLGDGRTAELYERAVVHLEAMGGERVDIDFAPFREAGSLLYDGAFVAERLEAAGRTLAENPEALVAPVRTILEGATRFDARAAFEAQHRLAGLRRRAGALLRQVDFLFVPTTPTIYADRRGRGVALAPQRAARHLRELRQPAGPGGDRGSARVPDGRPAGRRDADRAVGPGRVAGDVRLGAAPEDVADDGRDRRAVAGRRRTGGVAAGGDRIEIAVVGAHLSGEPLNHQLIELGGAVRARGPHRARLPALRAAGHDRRPSPA